MELSDVICHHLGSFVRHAVQDQVSFIFLQVLLDVSEMDVGLFYHIPGPVGEK